MLKTKARIQYLESAYNNVERTWYIVHVAYRISKIKAHLLIKMRPEYGSRYLLLTLLIGMLKKIFFF